VTGRPKASLVARSFRLSSVDGMLNPFGLEVLLNPEVLPFERPFVLAHEWAHLAGHADESEASFLAWLTCLEGDAAAQYSGWLAVLLHAVRGSAAGRAPPALAELEAGPRADIQALQQRFERSHPFVRAVSWQVYEQYLRANRVEPGWPATTRSCGSCSGSRSPPVSDTLRRHADAAPTASGWRRHSSRVFLVGAERRCGIVVILSARQEHCQSVELVNILQNVIIPCRSSTKCRSCDILSPAVPLASRRAIVTCSSRGVGGAVRARVSPS
jgi:hypothetical protein